MASSVNSLTGSSSSDTSSTTSSSSSSGSEQVFLQLLVSQLQNQDPMNPTDSTQFVSELAQFSELEQVIAIRGDIETYQTESATASASAGQSTSATTQS